MTDVFMRVTVNVHNADINADNTKHKLERKKKLLL